MDDEAVAKSRIRLRIIVLLLLLIFLAGVGCQPFHPREAISIPRIAGETALPVEFPLPQVRMEIVAHDSLEQSLEIFDGDLPRAGIHPVWVRLKNDGEYTLKLDDTRISVTCKGARLSQLIPPKQVVELLYQSYRTRMYSPYFRDQLEKRFEELRFKMTSVSPGQEVSGHFFFLMDSRDYGLLSGAQLRWTEIRSSGGPEPLNVEYTFPGP
jgi:hypothetical protein